MRATYSPVDVYVALFKAHQNRCQRPSTAAVVDSLVCIKNKCGLVVVVIRTNCSVGMCNVVRNNPNLIITVNINTQFPA